MYILSYYFQIHVKHKRNNILLSNLLSNIYQIFVRYSLNINQNFTLNRLDRIKHYIKIKIHIIITLKF